MAITINKTEIWDIAKRNFGILLIGTLFLIFYFGGCGGRNARGGINTSDTVTTTTQVLQPIVVNPPYTPQQQGSTVYVPIPQSAQGVVPASTMEGLIAQVKDLSARIEELGKQYYATKHYQDSIQLRDTAGTRVGVVNLKQTVSENTLQSTQPTYQLAFPYTVRTITNTIYPKIKNQWFIGGGAQTLLNKPTIQQAELGMLFKNKKENVLSVSGVYDFPAASPGVRLAYYQKIQFNLFNKKALLNPSQ